MLPADDVRYAVADVNYNTNDGPRTEIVFISWAPDTSSVKRRMLSASSKETLKNILVGCKTSIQACSKTDMELRPIVLDKFKGTLEWASKSRELSETPLRPFLFAFYLWTCEWSIFFSCFLLVVTHSATSHPDTNLLRTLDYYANGLFLHAIKFDNE